MSMATATDENMDWIKALEQKVSAVTREMADLRKKNRSLVAKVGRLEREAREMPAGEGNEWEAEKKEIRTRVERLAGNLESLLEEE
jgi:regulator of replication initiation timing